MIQNKQLVNVASFQSHYIRIMRSSRKVSWAMRRNSQIPRNWHIANDDTMKLPMSIYAWVSKLLTAMAKEWRISFWSIHVIMRRYFTIVYRLHDAVSITSNSNNCEFFFFLLFRLAFLFSECGGAALKHIHYFEPIHYDYTHIDDGTMPCAQNEYHLMLRSFSAQRIPFQIWNQNKIAIYFLQDRSNLLVRRISMSLRDFPWNCFRNSMDVASRTHTHAHRCKKH